MIFEFVDTNFLTDLVKIDSTNSWTDRSKDIHVQQMTTPTSHWSSCPELFYQVPGMIFL